jgi:hypothetical protein
LMPPRPLRVIASAVLTFCALLSSVDRECIARR